MPGFNPIMVEGHAALFSFTAGGDSGLRLNDFFDVKNDYMEGSGSATIK